MTIAELIDAVLGSIRGQFYADRPREFRRDQSALTKAIARWGYACHERGWDFEPQFILQDVMTLLQHIKTSGVSFDYLPVYLQGAINRRVGQRSEELQAASRKLAPKAAKIVRDTQRVSAVVTPGNTELMARLYSDLARQQRLRRSAHKHAPKQGQLL